VIEALVLVGGLAISSTLMHAIKAAEDRPRPAGQLVETASSSFPSGHATYAVAYVAVAVAVARALPSTTGRVAVVVVALVVAAAIGLSRIYLHAHYLSDVVAGWGLGAAVFALCAIAGLIVAHLRQNQRP
jgi:undecaprenyl-diphosphatase